MIEGKKITVIVPAYNVGEWLPRCLDSILCQTYRDLEILVIDDGSTDGTPSIVDCYAGMDERIVPIHQENAGLIAVRERGIRSATGDYVGFVDGDDTIEPDMYERLLANALAYDAEISQCGILYCFYDGRKKPVHGTGELHVFDRMEGYRELMRGTRMEPSLCNKIYRRDLLTDSCPDPTIVNNEDLLRNAVLFQRAERSVFEDFCGYHYWRRAESMSNNRIVVRTGKNILAARKLILDSAEPEARNDALESYVTGVITTYHSLIFRKDEEAEDFRLECRNELLEFRPQIKHLSKKTRYQVGLILRVPGIYSVIRKIHTNRRRARIRKAAREARRQNELYR